MAGNDIDGRATNWVTCYSYTHARRFPLVIGKIGGFTLPTPLSPSQSATLLGSFFLMLGSRRWWGAFLPGMADALFLVLVPGTLTWAVRHLRMEGRNPVKMLLGLLSLLLAPTQGTVRGRQVWAKARPRRMIERIYIAGDTTSHTPLESHPRPKPSPAVAQLLPTSPWACLDDEASA